MPSWCSNALTLAVPISAPGAELNASSSVNEAPAVSLNDTVGIVLDENPPVNSLTIR